MGAEREWLDRMDGRAYHDDALETREEEIRMEIVCRKLVVSRHVELSRNCGQLVYELEMERLMKERHRSTIHIERGEQG